MSTFLQLYGEDLSRELGSADVAALFTTDRRKAATNAAMRWFVVQSECLRQEGSIPLVDGTAEYDLEASIAADLFHMIATKASPYVKQQPAAGAATYLTGEDFTRRDVAWLDRYEPGWRAASSGTPEAWYERQEGGQRLLGLYPPPKVPAGATWTLFVPYVVFVADMAADGDEPFTVGGNVKKSLRAWHDALPLYAASELEKLRKGVERSLLLRQAAESRVLDYLDKQRPPGGRTVRVARTYRRDARRSRSWRAR